MRFDNGVSGHIAASRIATGRKMGYAYEVQAPKARSALIRKIRTRLWLYHGDDRTATRFSQDPDRPGAPRLPAVLQGAGHGTGYQDQIIIEAHDFLSAIDTGEAIWPTFQRRSGSATGRAACAPRMRAKRGQTVANLLRKGHNMTSRSAMPPVPGVSNLQMIRATRTGGPCCSENAEAGYKGIELGPVGFMPEDPPQSRCAGRKRSGADRRRRVPRRSMTRSLG